MCIRWQHDIGQCRAAGMLEMAGSAGVGRMMALALGDENAFPDRLREEIEAIVRRHTLPVGGLR